MNTITLPRSVVEQALEALTHAEQDCADFQRVNTDQTGEAIEALRAALEQEPEAWDNCRGERQCRIWCGNKHCVSHPAVQPPVVEQPQTATDCHQSHPQSESPTMTSVAQRKLDDLLTRGYQISGYSVYHDTRHQHGFVTTAGLVGWWKPEGAEYPQPQGEQEPVAWQRRMRAKWMRDGEWCPWQECSKEMAYDYKQAPVVDDWEYESRPLYTHPQPPRKPLTDDERQDVYAKAIKAINNDPHLPWRDAIVFETERAHGIGGEK